MPIKFRCGYCKRLLGIARRKAGTEATCPHCRATITVPHPPPEDGTQLLDNEELWNPQAAQSPPRPSSPREVPALPLSTPQPQTNEPPLFEKDLEQIFGNLGGTPALPEPESSKALAASELDTMSLGEERGHWVLSTAQATILGVVILVMVILSFIAGYLVGAR